MTRRKNRGFRIPQPKRFRSSGRNRFRGRAARQFPINRAPVEPAGRSLPRAEARIFDAFLRRLRPEKAVLPKENSEALPSSAAHACGVPPAAEEELCLFIFMHLLSPQHSPHKFGSALGLSKMKQETPEKFGSLLFVRPQAVSSRSSGRRPPRRCGWVGCDPPRPLKSASTTR